MQVGAQDAAEHVAPRAGDVGIAGLGVESGLRTQSRLVDGQPVEPCVEVGPAFGRRDIAAQVVARDDVVVPEVRERARAADFHGDQRPCRVDLEDGLAAPCSALVEAEGKRRRRDLGAARGLRRSGRLRLPRRRSQLRGLRRTGCEKRERGQHGQHCGSGRADVPPAAAS